MTSLLDSMAALQHLPMVPASLRPPSATSIRGASMLFVVQLRLADGSCLPLAAGGSLDAALESFGRVVQQRRVGVVDLYADPTWRRIEGLAGRWGGIELPVGPDGQSVQVHAVTSTAF